MTANAEPGGARKIGAADTTGGDEQRERGSEAKVDHEGYFSGSVAAGTLAKELLAAIGGVNAREDPKPEI